VNVTLLIHLERAEDEDGARLVWWAETDDLPGFSAAADHLPDLLDQAAAAINEIAGEPVEIHTLLVPADEASAGPDPIDIDAELASARGVETRRITGDFVSV